MCFIISNHSDQSVVILRVMTLMMHCINNKEKTINYNEISTKTIAN